MNAKSLRFLAAMAVLAACAACSSQKEPATQALTGLENSVSEVKDDAERFASEQYASARKAVADLRASYDQKDYKTVVTGSPGVQKQITDLRDTVATRRKEFEVASAQATESWNGFAAEMPRHLETLQKKLDSVKKRKSDKGPSENSLLLDDVRNTWADASNLFSSGKPIDAAKRAEEARAKAQELAQKLGAKLQ